MRIAQRRVGTWALGAAVWIGGALSGAIAHTITVQPARTSPPPLTVKTVDPRLIQGACLQALQRETGPAQTVRPEHLRWSAGDDETSVICLIDAHLLERTDPFDRFSPERVTTAQYGVRIDLQDGTTQVARVDETAARQAALAALAALSIDPIPVSVGEHRIVYRADVKGKTCTVNMTNTGTSDLKVWRTDALTCKRR